MTEDIRASIAALRARYPELPVTVAHYVPVRDIEAVCGALEERLDEEAHAKAADFVLPKFQHAICECESSTGDHCACGREWPCVVATKGDRE
jgi:hypothetical protein